MKNKLIKNLMILGFPLLLSYDSLNDVEDVIEVEGELTCGTVEVIDDCKVELPPRFNKINKSIKKYNPEIDTLTVIKIIEVSNHYGFSSNNYRFRWLIGQILLESGAQQYYRSKHPNSGKLVISSAGAIGITQILPSTAYHYMLNKITYEELSCMYELGITNFDFVNDKTISKKEKINKCKEWLSVIDNNIIMWGCIMNHHLSDYNLKNSLISYNAGRGGLRKYLSNGNVNTNHDYIKGIKSRLKYVII